MAPPRAYTSRLDEIHILQGAFSSQTSEDPLSSESIQMDESEPYQESSTVRLDWTIHGLKQLFDSSKGDAKSKVTKSIKFGGGRWQVLFYPNSGAEGGQYISLYLSCEPTDDEKENAVNGRWVRDGLYKFSFELRNLSRTVLFNQKEANDHSFSWKTANWGWAQFARRDTVYYQPHAVRNMDAFLIICIITSSPAPPSIPSPFPHRSVPRDLLDAVGSLLDDPKYSDVEFVLPRRGGRRGSRKIYATRTLLRRAEYFESMFDHGFAESCSHAVELSSSQADLNSSFIHESDPDSPGGTRQLQDSDEEDEEELTDNDGDFDDGNHEESAIATSHMFKQETAAVVTRPQSPTITVEDVDAEKVPIVMGHDEGVEDGRNVRAKLSHPSSPRVQERHTELNISVSVQTAESFMQSSPERDRGPKKVRVVVEDVAYATYQAVLYYLYTDTIVFAPLASSFLSPSASSPVPSPAVPPKSQGEGQNLIPLASSSNLRPQLQSEHSNFGPTSRRAWIREWSRQNPGRITPCSAKAVYRIADKLDLEVLKNRAFQHITKSLTITNVPYEMFSTFSATFDEVRKTQVAFFLENWNEIRSSEAMKAVWQQIRVGRHPGFEEVWPLIAMNLEYKARSSDSATGDNQDGGKEI